ncbi:ATP synthase delta chain, chloroplastic [Cryptomeria japonica]|uniref:ATP synthase delta chain, chloroplastic n=1 Tax=Cryptomeria japonica TaxID=3369 RepID=UPI0025AC04F7|nr:ATP synthase delta chain, chloroplastic [Cryptomeria japonica]
MESLKQSPVALNMQCAPSARALFKGANGPISQLSIKCAFFGTRLVKTHKPLSTKVSQVVRRNRTRIVMSDSVAGSYATALADLGKSVNSLDAINSDLEKLSQFLVNKDIFAFLVNPIILPEKKKEILKSIAVDAKFEPYTLNFLFILIDKKRIKLINEIIKEFEITYNKLTDTELAIVTSAVKLENRHLHAIAKKVQSFTNAKNVRLKTVIDPSLIAGFTIRFGSSGSNMIDMSVKTELEKLAGQIGYNESIQLV